MTLAIWFYILMLLWLVFGFYWYWPGRAGSAGWWPLGGNSLLFLLLLILGIAQFGSPVK
jgi:hypothetical protein